MAMQQVTIFGGSGFIGRHLVARLAATGATVRVAARHPALMPTSPGQVRFKLVRADILDEAEVRAAIQGCDAVINLVGILVEGEPQTFTAIHEEGARRVAAIAHNLGVKQLIHMSALGVSRAAPALADRSKAAGEEAVRAAFPDVTIVRPSMVFGPDDHFFNRFATLAQRLPVLPLIGGGRTKFQPVYVEDVVDGFTAILACPARRGRTYEFGGPRIYTFKELLGFLCAEIRARPLLVPLPFWMAEALGVALQSFPDAPLTRDQVRLLRTDKIVSGAETLANLGIEPKALEAVVPEYLAKYRN
jgi:NADH dehydrogenase